MNTEKKTVLNTGICFHQIWLLQIRNIVAACSSINRWLDACYFMMCHREVSIHTACCFLLFFRKSCGSCCLWVGCCVGTVFCAHMLLNLPRQETQTWQRYIICDNSYYNALHEHVSVSNVMTTSRKKKLWNVDQMTWICTCSFINCFFLSDIHLQFSQIRLQDCVIFINFFCLECIT